MTSPDEPQAPHNPPEPQEYGAGWATPPAASQPPAGGSVPPAGYQLPPAYEPPAPGFAPPTGYVPPAGFQTPPVYEIPQGSTPWAGPAMPPAKPKSKLPWIITAAVAILALVGAVGGYKAYQTLSGGGTRPEAILPSDTFAFASVDLDPSASQKLDAYDFLHKMPKVGSSFDQRKDLKKSVYDAIASLGGFGTDVNYERDIKPWLGDRLAVGARPSASKGSDPEAIIVIQSKDDGKARASIAKLSQNATDPVFIGFRKGYVVMSNTQAHVDRAIADGARSSLKSNKNFSADMGLIGDQGFTSGWVDIGALLKVLPQSALGALGGNALGSFSSDSARLAFAARFLDGGAEFVFKAIGKGSATTAAPSQGFPTLGDLPADTAAGARVYGLDKTVDQAWAAFQKAFDSVGGSTGGSSPIKQFEDQFGVSLPADLKTLVGSDLIAAVSGSDLKNKPTFGVRSHTDGTAADKVLQKLTANGVNLPGWKVLPDGFALATTEAYADVLAKPSGAKLGDLAAFKKAIANPGTGQFELFVNIATIADQLGDQTTNADARQAIKAFSAVGVSVGLSGNVQTGTVRVILR